MEKSYVGMESKVCPICTKQHNHKCGVLIDKRLKATLDKDNVTGWGLCEDDEKKIEDGYIVLIEIDPDKSESALLDDGKYSLDGIHRTGMVAFVKANVAMEIFSDSGINEDTTLIIVEKGVIDILKIIAERNDSNPEVI